GVVLVPPDHAEHLAWDGLAAEARCLMTLLAERDPRVYGRYDHWWAKLPEGQVRVLPG
ncbi:winged helix DNA-binding domain-containing protein, partial [Streptomyces sp. NPDC007861]